MPSFAQLEFHRAGVGLVPAGGTGAETAIWVPHLAGSREPLRSCNCTASRTRACDHLRALDRALAELERARAGKRDEVPAETRWESAFPGTVWYRLARLLQEGSSQPCGGIRLSRRQSGGGDTVELRVTTASSEELARYFDASPAQLRFLERTGQAGGAGHAFDRAGLLSRLALFQLSADERALAKHGVKTQRLTWEESFWHRLAYHCVRELGDAGGTFHPAIDTMSGRFTLAFRSAGEPFVEVTVPRGQVRAALKLLAEAYPQQQDLAIHPIPLRSIFHVTQETRFDLAEVVVRPAIEAIQASGEARYFRADEVERFRYGNLVYLEELGILAELERPGHERKFRAPLQMRLTRSQVPSFLAENSAAWEEGALVLDELLRHRKIFRDFDAVEITREALARSWYWLAIHYAFGNESISLAELLRARRGGLPFVEIGQGWIDLNAPAFSHLERLAEDADRLQRPDAVDTLGVLAENGGTADGDSVRLSASELLRLQAAAGKPLTLAAGAAPGGGALACLLELRPLRPLTPLAGLASALRHYQRIGVEWLRFLWENRLGGLLCDDMGLGKTHQAMALLVALAEHEGITSPFLVVCPTSVIIHWRDKLRDHAPGLRPLIHHGAQRSLPSPLLPGDVVVTSYGVLLRDAPELAKTGFSVAFFDEIQNLKNRDTKTYQAAQQLQAEVKLGLTGTPIENSLDDLRALFDLVLPGYLGNHPAFARRPAGPAPLALDVPDAARPRQEPTPLVLALELPRAESAAVAAQRQEAEDERALGELRRMISPFVLRRLKSAVLDELPEKIEDLRACQLSADQVRLYREAVGGRGAELARAVAAADGPLPYIHIFALLQLLKQICDHPALALRRLDEAEQFTSGKWDLYRELLSECLESGQKVVVFTHFLGMITLMQRHLEGLGVDHVSLTGASGGSARRGSLIERFNREPGCRVFLGSLKAGGSGIDLAAASTVIHYDRWWNAAREDQATDRVHRIGQRRAVQVFKLVTEGTLEEKISAIIERKRRLMNSVVQHHDPALAKIFTRAELLDLLQGV
jgi:superfamily II DNA or RNA helicase